MRREKRLEKRNSGVDEDRPSEDMDGLVFFLFFLLSGPKVIDMYERVESNDHPQVFLFLLLLCLKK